MSAAEAAAAERQRLARALHDSLGYTLNIALVQLENAARLTGEEPEEARAIILAVRERIAGGLEELRRTLRSLREQEIGGDVFEEAMQRLAGEFAATTGIAVQTRLPEALPRLSDAQATALFLTAQEALVNAWKHGGAEEVSVSLAVEDGFAVLKVGDDGRGDAPAQGSGFGGLAGVKERADQLGGSLLVVKPREGGVLLTMRLPLKGEGDA